MLRVWSEETVGVTEMFALWHLLLGICVATPIVASLAEARRASVEVAGYTLALIVGIALGALFGWSMWATHWAVGNKIMKAAPAKQEWYSRALYFTRLLWTALAAFVAGWLSKVLLRVTF